MNSLDAGGGQFAELGVEWKFHFDQLNKAQIRNSVTLYPKSNCCGWKKRNVFRKDRFEVFPITKSGCCSTTGHIPTKDQFVRRQLAGNFR